MNGYYTTKHLLTELKKAKGEYPQLDIGASYPSLVKYQKLGLTVSVKKVQFAERKWRVFTWQEILKTVQNIIEYKGKKMKADKRI